MKIVKISDLSDDEKEKWQEQVIVRQEEKENFIKKETEEANRLFNEGNDFKAYNKKSSRVNREILPTQQRGIVRKNQNEFKKSNKEAKKNAISNMIIGPIKDMAGLGKLVVSGASMGAKQVPYYLENATENNFQNYKRRNLAMNMQNASDKDRAILLASRPTNIANNRVQKDMSTTKNRINALEARGNNTNLIKNENNMSNLPRLEKEKTSTKEDIEKSFKLSIRPNIETNLVKKGIRDSIIKDQDKIQDEQSKLSNPIAQKLGDIAPSVGQMLPGTALSAVNPVLRYNLFYNECCRWIY